MELHEWIKQDLNRWKAICKAEGKFLTDEQALRAMGEVIEHMQRNNEFLAVAYVLMTNYEVDPDVK